jgi:polar amino acid transport system substrate-binding protein
VAINLGNGVLAQKNSETGAFAGVSVRLAETFADKLELALEFIEFPEAGKVVDAVNRDEWDLAFLAIDPLRSKSILFTNPYVIIEGAYLVRAESSLRFIDDVDKDDIRIAVGKNAAYDLYLSRTLQYAELVRAPTTPGAVDLFLAENLDVAAGIKSSLVQLAKGNNRVRVLGGTFMQINQAMAVPTRATAVKTLMNSFINEMLTSDFIKEELANSGQDPSVTASPE